MVADVEVTDAVMPGVVCVPHGWPEPANSNVLTPSTGLDAVAGTAVLNGIPVSITPHLSPTRARG